VRSKTARLGLAAMAGWLSMATATACKSDDATPTTTGATVVEATTAAPTTTSLASTATTKPKPGMNPDEIAVRNVLDVEAAEFAAASDPPDPNRSGMLALNTGAARDKRVEVITGLRDRGEYSRRAGGGTVPHKTDGVDFENTNTAVAYECYVDDRVRRKIGTDEVVNATVTSTRLRTRVIREADGAWRISSRESLESLPTSNACPNVGF
jgi:hypothetical protein